MTKYDFVEMMTKEGKDGNEKKMCEKVICTHICTQMFRVLV